MSKKRKGDRAHMQRASKKRPTQDIDGGFFFNPYADISKINAQGFEESWDFGTTQLAQKVGIISAALRCVNMISLWNSIDYSEHGFG
jgi:hypothetical protein